MSSSYWDDVYDDEDDDQRPRLSGELTEPVLVDEDRINFKLWQAAGFSADEAATWARRGLTVSQAIQARRAGFSPERAYNWVAAGYDDPSEWVSDPDDGAQRVHVAHDEIIPAVADTFRMFVIDVTGIDPTPRETFDDDDHDAAFDDPRHNIFVLVGTGGVELEDTADGLAPADGGRRLRRALRSDAGQLSLF